MKCSINKLDGGIGNLKINRYFLSIVKKAKINCKNCLQMNKRTQRKLVEQHKENTINYLRRDDDGQNTKHCIIIKYAKFHRNYES